MYRVQKRHPINQTRSCTSETERILAWHFSLSKIMRHKTRTSENNKKAKCATHRKDALKQNALCVACCPCKHTVNNGLRWSSAFLRSGLPFQEWLFSTFATECYCEKQQSKLYIVNKFTLNNKHNNKAHNRSYARISSLQTARSRSTDNRTWTLNYSQIFFTFSW